MNQLETNQTFLREAHQFLQWKSIISVWPSAVSFCSNFNQLTNISASNFFRNYSTCATSFVKGTVKLHSKSRSRDELVVMNISHRSVR